MKIKKNTVNRKNSQILVKERKHENDEKNVIS